MTGPDADSVTFTPAGTVHASPDDHGGGCDGPYNCTCEPDGWACTDCTMLLANGETPPELDEPATEAWLDEINRRTDGYTVVPTDHYDEFSWSSCAVCGTTLGGSRYGVAFLEREAVGQ